MSESPPDTNNQLMSFAGRLNTFQQNLKEATNNNTTIVENISKETENILKITVELSKIITSSITSLKQMAKTASSSGIPAGPINEQIKKLDELLKKVNNELAIIKGDSQKGLNISKNLDSIKSILEEQKKTLNDNSGTSGSSQSNNIFGNLFSTQDTGDISETQLGGNKHKNRRGRKGRSLKIKRKRSKTPKKMVTRRRKRN